MGEKQRVKGQAFVLQSNNVHLAGFTEIHTDLTVTPGPRVSVR